MSYTKAKKINRNNHSPHRLPVMALSALLCTSALVAVKPASANDLLNDDAIVVAMYTDKTTTIQSTSLSSDRLYDLALKFIDGDGVPEDEAYGLTLLEKAAKRGHTKAQFALGVMYAEDEEEIALYWLSKAAEKGHENAQFVYNQVMSNDFSVGC